MCVVGDWVLERCDYVMVEIGRDGGRADDVGTTTALAMKCDAGAISDTHTPSVQLLPFLSTTLIN